MSPNTQLPKQYSYEWTDLAFQEKAASGLAFLIFPLCILFVWLTHSAEYESFALSTAIILIVPMCLLCGIAAVWARHMDNNIFTQIGFVVLAGMSVKNAVLIVEFAKQQQEHHRGMKAAEAAIEAARLRLRPILMTSFAFIFGVIPLIIATGAGAEMRQALGTVVFFGMIGVTFFGVFLTPVFYTVIRRLTGHRPVPAETASQKRSRLRDRPRQTRGRKRTTVSGSNKFATAVFEAFGKRMLLTSKRALQKPSPTTAPNSGPVRRRIGKSRTKKDRNRRRSRRPSKRTRAALGMAPGLVDLHLGEISSAEYGVAGIRVVI